MKRTTALIALMIAVLLGVQERSLAQRQTREGPEALRQRIEQRYNVVPITNGVALTPKNRRGDVRLIEVSDAIAINGTVAPAQSFERAGRMPTRSCSPTIQRLARPCSRRLPVRRRPADAQPAPTPCRLTAIARWNESRTRRSRERLR